MVPKRLVGPLSGKTLVFPLKALHVRWIQNHAVDLPITVGKRSAVNAGFDIGSQEMIVSLGYIFPKYSFPVSNIGHLRSRRNVQAENFGKNITIVTRVRGKDKIGCFYTAWGRTFFLDQSYHGTDCNKSFRIRKNYFLGRPAFFRLLANNSTSERSIK